MANTSSIALADSQRLNIVVEGQEGAPWVTLSNSLVTDLSLWDDFAAAIRRRYRVLRYDQRGHGHSSPASGDLEIHQLAADVVAIWDHLNIERSHVVGVSLGGAITLAVAIDHPGRVLSIVPCDCRADSTGGARDWAERLAKARAEGIGALAEPTIERWFTPESLAAKLPVIERVREMIRTTSIEGYAGGIAALLSCNLTDSIARIVAPTLLVCGEKDVALKSMQELSRTITGSEFAIVAGARHLPMIEQPRAFADVVGRFLDNGRKQGGRK